MKLDFLNSLQCPDCKQTFKLGEVYTKDGNDLVNALIECDCFTYPILDGILIYKKPAKEDYLSRTPYLNERLRIGKSEDSIALSIEGQKLDKMLMWAYLILNESGAFKRSIQPILSLIRHIKRKRYRKYADEKLSFFDLVDLMGWGTWGDYLKHRFSCQTFWSLYPLIPIIKEKNDMVLDMLCGTGHASYAIERYSKPKKLVCSDYEYTLLFIAKKYFVKDAEFICADGNSPLPFKSGIFSSILILDSYFCLSNRGILARESERCLRQGGIVLPLHLHNSMVENISQGFALKPSGWSGLFQKMKTKIIPEDNLIEEYLLKRELDLSKEYTQEEINGSPAISIVGTNDEKVFDFYSNIDVPSRKDVRNLVINPIYEINRRGNQIHLDLQVPTEMYEKEYPLTMKYLNKNFVISSEISRYIRGNRADIPVNISAKDRTQIDDLIKKFVLIDIPENYL